MKNARKTNFNSYFSLPITKAKNIYIIRASKVISLLNYFLL